MLSKISCLVNVLLVLGSSGKGICNMTQGEGMIEDIPEVLVTFSNEMAEAFQKLNDKLESIQKVLSEERIRAIVREEIAAWEKQQVVTRRVQVGWLPNVETK